MATMFKSVLVTSNSGGKGVTLTVICDPEFAGATIYCTKSGTNLSKTCPSTSPYEVTFTLKESGTYTISGTVSGMEHSTTIDVDVDLEVELKYGFNWVEWVNASQNYTNSDFNDLDDLLSNEEAIRELMTIHDCVDILADTSVVTEDVEKILNNDLCAKWINLRDYALDTLYANTIIKGYMDTADKYGYGEWCLMPQVPTMTSATTPSGVVSASSEGGNYKAWMAFDNSSDASSFWLPQPSTKTDYNDWIEYEFINPIAISEVKAVIKSLYSVPNMKYQVRAYDGSEWVVLGGDTFSINNQTLNLDLSFVNSVKYAKYRVYFDTMYIDNVYTIETHSLQFYAYAPKGNVPVMTTNNAPYGTVGLVNTTPYNPSNNPAFKAFDNNDATMYSSNKVTTGGYAIVYYKFTNPVCPHKFDAFSYSGAPHINQYKIVGSNDGSTWIDLTTAFNEDLNSHKQHDIDTDNYYLYLGIYVTGVSDGYTIANAGFYLTSLQFYGRELSVSAPTMTSNTTPYGVASVSSSYAADFEAYKAFDGNDSTDWVSARGSATAYLQYQFNNPIVLKQLSFKPYWGSSLLYVKSFKLQASNTGESDDWIDILATQQLSNSNVGLVTYNLSDNTSPYKFYKLADIETYETDYYEHAIYTVNLFGLDYSEREFEEGTTKKWLYDHGVELEILDRYKGSQTTSNLPSTIKDEMYITNAGGAEGPSNFAVVGATVNLAPYTLCRCKVGDVVVETFNTDNSPISLICWKTNGIPSGGTYDGNNIDATIVPNLPYSNPNTAFSLDISALNENKWVSIGTFYRVGRVGTIKEFWLE